MYDLYIKKAVDAIKKTKAKLVCIQLPDGLKPSAMDIRQELIAKTDAKIIFWGGSCYGACDLPLALDKLGVDLLIQWGHSEWLTRKIY